MTVLNDSEQNQQHDYNRYNNDSEDGETSLLPQDFRPIACVYATKFHELADKYDCPVSIISEYYN